MSNAKRSGLSDTALHIRTAGVLTALFLALEMAPYASARDLTLTYNEDGSSPSTVNPQADYFPTTPEFPKYGEKSGADFWKKSAITHQVTYYGRARTSEDKKNEIHVNALGNSVHFISGYAWDTVGFDLRLNANLGRGNGWSEVLVHDVDKDTDRSTAMVGEAALKVKLGQPDDGVEFKGGYLPIRIGTLGSLGGLHPHSYRGIELKGFVGDLWVGYGWADRFHNEWDDTYRIMTTKWHQNRGSFSETDRAPEIPYIHSIGARYVFGPDKKAFLDSGVGEGSGYRTNAQVSTFYPLKIPGIGEFNFTGYALWGKYKEEKTGIADPRNETHYSLSAELKTGAVSWFLAYGQTHSPDSGEMNFRMTAWANSDNRNFIQTWAQLDDFVWDGEKVIEIGIDYEIGKHIGIPGLALSAHQNIGWDMRVPGQDKRGKAWEFNGGITYAVPKGLFKGITFGVYPARLRTKDFYVNGYGKQDRDDVKVVISYSTTFDMGKKSGGK